MARPLFIVCSESGSIDRYSNRLSAYKILETIEIVGYSDYEKLRSSNTDDELPLPIITIRAVATWIGDPEDAGAEYEYQSQVHYPGTNSAKPVGSGRFRWAAKNHRVIADLVLDPQALEAGALRIEISIRPFKPDARWLTQQYEIAVERMPVRSNTSQ